MLPKCNAVQVAQDGEDYFEAVQFCCDVRQSFYENYLALCPTCAAKYQHARTTTDEELKEQLKVIDPDGTRTVEVAVMLVGQPATLSFVGTHTLDLKVILK